MNNTQLTQKEKLFLSDLKSQEELCIKKYTKFANETQDKVLKQIFNQLSQSEQQHYNTITQILSQGNSYQSQQSWKSQSGGQSSQQSSQSQQNQSQTNPLQQLKSANLKSNEATKNDFDLVHDLLSTEKYVSSTYNTAVFEFNNSTIRQELNHIQKEEQEHGEILYNYLKQNGGYQAQA